MQQFDIIIVGGGYAGTMCALRLAGKAKGRLRIALINAEQHFVERLRLHEPLVSPPKIQMRSFDFKDLLSSKRVQFFCGAVTALDRGAKHVMVGLPNGEVTTLGYNRLVIAAGSTSSIEHIEGQAEHSYVLDQEAPQGVKELAATIKRVKAPRITVVGAGATGIEVAAELAQKSGARVCLIAANKLGTGLSEGVIRRVKSKLSQANIEIIEHTRIHSIQADRVTFSGGNVLHDICVSATGFSVGNLWQRSGLQTTENGRICTDPYLRARQNPSIFAAGDACYLEVQKSAPARMSVMFALTSGAHVADAILDDISGRVPRRFGFWTYGQAIGLGQSAVGFGNMRFDRAYPPYFTGRVGYHLRNFFVSILYKLLMLEARRPGLPFYLGRPMRRNRELWTANSEENNGGR